MPNRVQLAPAEQLKNIQKDKPQRPHQPATDSQINRLDHNGLLHAAIALSGDRDYITRYAAWRVLGYNDLITSSRRLTRKGAKPVIDTGIRKPKLSEMPPIRREIPEG